MERAAISKMILKTRTHMEAHVILLGRDIYIIVKRFEKFFKHVSIHSLPFLLRQDYDAGISGINVGRIFRFG